VLLVDEDREVLRVTSARLIRAGYEVSTRRSAEGLLAAVERLEPDLVMVDVLMNGLENETLSLLLAHARLARPKIVVHSRLCRNVLAVVVDLNEIHGIIQKTGDDDRFAEALGEISERLPALTLDAPASPNLLGPATSGTHRIGGGAEVVEFLRANGTRRTP
jgi:FixJ family two-component response regulator